MCDGHGAADKEGPLGVGEEMNMVGMDVLSRMPALPVPVAPRSVAPIWVDAQRARPRKARTVEHSALISSQHDAPARSNWPRDILAPDRCRAGRSAWGGRFCRRSESRTRREEARAMNHARFPAQVKENLMYEHGFQTTQE